MKRFHLALLVYLYFFGFYRLDAQNVSITPNGITPVQGYQRVQYEQLDQIQNAEEGDIVYDTTFKLLRLLINGKWMPLNLKDQEFSVSIQANDLNLPFLKVSKAKNKGYYYMGRFSNSITLGNFTLTGFGDGDIFIAKVDSNGLYKWARSIGGASNDFGTKILSDSLDNVYFSGGNFNTVNFSGNILPYSSGQDSWMAKYDSLGNYQWVRSFSGASYQAIKDFEISNLGEIYIGIDYQNEIYLPDNNYFTQNGLSG
ncbi:MAG: hypothetical protein ACRCVT_11010, partial [Leadbetterella sp.]